jgi:desulfoferrodoxin-like iron-binding protein
MSEPDDSNQPGRRYRCEVCGTELMCLKRGAGRFICHGQKMVVVELQALPASD